MTSRRKKKEREKLKRQKRKLEGQIARKHSRTHVYAVTHKWHSWM